MMSERGTTHHSLEQLTPIVTPRGGGGGQVAIAVKRCASNLTNSFPDLAS